MTTPSLRHVVQADAAIRYLQDDGAPGARPPYNSGLRDLLSEAAWAELRDLIADRLAKLEATNANA
jgi:hypothetical protein